LDDQAEGRSYRILVIFADQVAGAERHRIEDRAVVGRIALRPDRLQTQADGDQDTAVPQADRVRREQAGQAGATDRERIVEIAADQRGTRDRDRRRIIEV